MKANILEKELKLEIVCSCHFDH